MQWLYSNRRSWMLYQRALNRRWNRPNPILYRLQIRQMHYNSISIVFPLNAANIRYWSNLTFFSLQFRMLSLGWWRCYCTIFGRPIRIVSNACLHFDLTLARTLFICRCPFLWKASLCKCESERKFKQNKNNWMPWKSTRVPVGNFSLRWVEYWFLVVKWERR